MQSVIKEVLETFDYGRECWDVTVEARQISRMFKNGLLRIDDEAQRGRNSMTDKQIFKKQKVDRWARELQEGTAVFGQLTWNFRPEETDAYYDPEKRQFIIEDGSATLPDSAHRHRAIDKAVESAANGSDFNIHQKFSVRIWRVPAEDEPKIFFWMNQEGDKADATRSKWLHQKTIGQRLAERLVRKSPFLTKDNVETVTNGLSIKNPRLAAFNTFSGACEMCWDDLPEKDFEVAASFLVDYWAKLVDVRPELQRLDQGERLHWRQSSLSSQALGIHGFIGLARLLHNGGFDLDVLEALRDTRGERKTGPAFFSFDNPIWSARGIVVPNKNGRLQVRNAHQSRREIIRVLAERVGVGDATEAA